MVHLMRQDFVGVMESKMKETYFPVFHTGGISREGIGRRLFDAFIRRDFCAEMTVNSSTYAVPFYKKSGI